MRACVILRRLGNTSGKRIAKPKSLVQLQHAAFEHIVEQPSFAVASNVKFFTEPSGDEVCDLDLIENNEVLYVAINNETWRPPTDDVGGTAASAAGTAAPAASSSTHASVPVDTVADVPSEELNFIIFGETGMGKSTLINSARDQNELRSGGQPPAETKDQLPPSGDGTTQALDCYDFKQIHGVNKRVIIWDTPGLGTKGIAIADLVAQLKAEFGPGKRAIWAVGIVQPLVTENLSFGPALMSALAAEGLKVDRRNVVWIGSKADQVPVDDWETLCENFRTSFVQPFFGNSYVPEHGSSYVYTKTLRDEQGQKVEVTIDGFQKPFRMIDTTELEGALSKMEERTGHWDLSVDKLSELVVRHLHFGQQEKQELIKHLQQMEQDLEEAKKTDKDRVEMLDAALSRSEKLEEAQQERTRLMGLKGFQLKPEAQEAKAIHAPHVAWKRCFPSTGKKHEIINVLVAWKYTEVKLSQLEAKPTEPPEGWRKEERKGRNLSRPYYVWKKEFGTETRLCYSIVEAHQYQLEYDKAHQPSTSMPGSSRPERRRREERAAGRSGKRLAF